MADDYNKLYYEKNRQKLIERARQRRAQAKQKHLSLVPDEVQAPPQNQTESRVQGIQRRSNYHLLKLIAIGLLGTLVTLILLVQMIEFYSADPLPLRMTKAIATEGLVLFFSTLNHSKLGYRILYRLIALGMCLLSIYAMSAKHIDAFMLNSEKHKIAFSSIQGIQGSIQSKQELQERYVKDQWLTAAKRNAEGIDALQSRLEQSRTLWLETQSQTHTFLVQVLTRVFFMLGNILIARKLFCLNNK